MSHPLSHFLSISILSNHVSPFSPAYCPHSLLTLSCRRASSLSSSSSLRPSPNKPDFDHHHLRPARFFSVSSALIHAPLLAPWRPFDRILGAKGGADDDDGNMAPIVTNVEEITEKYIAENNVMIFSKSYCPFCLKVRIVLRALTLVWRGAPW